jgi:hypothetical protein
MIVIMILIKCIVFISLFIIGFLLVRKFFHNNNMESNNEVAGFIYAVVGVIYAVILGFVVINAWEQYKDAETVVDNEVSYSVSLIRISNAFPDSVKTRIQPAVIHYMEDCIAFEWDAMSKNKTSIEASKSYNSIWAQIYAYKPISNSENLWYNKFIDALNSLSQARRGRIIAIDSKIHPFMWIILFVGAFITIVFTYLFGTKNKTAHLLMIICLSASICSVLLLIEAFDHPFSGLIHVSSKPFIEALELIRH